MSIAKTPSAEIAYKGFVQTRTAENLQTTITYQSTEEKLHAMVGATSGWEITKSYGDYGTLDKITIKQEAGPFWHADLQYNRPLKSGITISSGEDKKPTESQLTVVMLELSIKTHKNYTLIWDNYFIAKETAQGTPTLETVEGWTKAEAEQYVATNTDFQFIEDKSQLPEEKWDDTTQTYVKWKIVYYPTKQGIDYYKVPTYELTEYAKHSDKVNAAWSLSIKSGKLKFPQNGDFGLEATYPAANNGRRWLCLGGDLNYDGKYWIARCTYQWANDENGWDSDMYEEPSAQDGGYNTSYPIPNSLMPQTSGSTYNNDMPQINGGD